MLSIWYGKNGSVKDNIKYGYDSKLNIKTVEENGIEIVRYTYPDLVLKENEIVIGKIMQQCLASYIFIIKVRKIWKLILKY